MNENKICSECKQEKPISEFNKDASKKGGLRPECKICSRNRAGEYRARIKELNTTLVVDHKICACCNIDKPSGAFYKHIGHWDGLSHFCKECFKKDYATRYETNPEKILKRCKEYRENNPEEREETLKKYNGSPKGKVTRVRSKHTRRTREKETEKTLTADQWVKILEMQDNKCAMCGRKFTNELKATQDHIVPLSKGGGLTFENTQALCMSCNCSKRDRLDYGKIQTYTLSPPAPEIQQPRNQHKYPDDDSANPKQILAELYHRRRRVVIRRRCVVR